MIEQDSVRLLRECDAGIKMGISSIDDVVNNTNDIKLQNALNDSKIEHEKLKSEIEHLLSEYGDDGKAPNPIAKGMSYIKTNVKLSIDGSDSAIAELITDGCNMGIKSLNKYLDQYKAADERSKDFAKKLIKMEERLCRTVKNYIQ
ncbi:MAG: hypothetical protein PUF48_01325 [Oscillospiraceae bacterium]|nr:hypothetical protein [Oscillospiraceae bacterium]